MTGSDLRAWREARGWSQERLAEQLGVTQSAVSFMESGARPITQRTVWRVEQIEQHDHPAIPAERQTTTD